MIDMIATVLFTFMTDPMKFIATALIIVTIVAPPIIIATDRSL